MEGAGLGKEVLAEAPDFGAVEHELKQKRAETGAES